MLFFGVSVFVCLCSSVLLCIDFTVPSPAAEHQDTNVLESSIDTFTAIMNKLIAMQKSRGW
jgi:hypothetical protein